MIVFAGIECPALSEIANGVISYAPDITPDYNVNTVATYTCDEGFVLRGGNEMRTCVDAGGGSSIGRFNGVAPTCERKQMKYMYMYVSTLVVHANYYLEPLSGLIIYT